MFLITLATQLVVEGCRGIKEVPDGHAVVLQNQFLQTFLLPLALLETGWVRVSILSSLQ